MAYESNSRAFVDLQLPLIKRGHRSRNARKGTMNSLHVDWVRNSAQFVETQHHSYVSATLACQP